MILLVLSFPLAGLGWAVSSGLPRCPPTPVCCLTCIEIPSDVLTELFCAVLELHPLNC